MFKISILDNGKKEFIFDNRRDFADYILARCITLFDNKIRDKIMNDPLNEGTEFKIIFEFAVAGYEKII